MLLYGLGGLGTVIIIILAVIFIAPVKELLLYWRAVKSRRTYRCPQCGTVYTLEHMQGENCSACGARLIEVRSDGRLKVSTEELPVSVEDRERPMREILHEKDGGRHDGTESE